MDYRRACTLDHHLSISFGEPDRIPDSDIDICFSRRDLHMTVTHGLMRSFAAHIPAPVLVI